MDRFKPAARSRPAPDTKLASFRSFQGMTGALNVYPSIIYNPDQYSALSPKNSADRKPSESYRQRRSMILRNEAREPGALQEFARLERQRTHEGMTPRLGPHQRSKSGILMNYPDDDSEYLRVSDDIPRNMSDLS